MKWKRTKGAQVVQDKVTGQKKPVAEVDIALNNLANQAHAQQSAISQGISQGMSGVYH